MKLDDATGMRIKITYRNEPAYLNIFPDAKEFFISSVADQEDKTMAGIDAITRGYSKLWQYAGIEVVIAQLGKASRGVRDLPGILKAELEKI